MAEQEMIARIAELERQVARKQPSGGLKVGEKGGVSFYGVGRRPVTLYASQWQIVAENMPAITKFISDNWTKLAHKEGEIAPEGVSAPAPATV